MGRQIYLFIKQYEEYKGKFRVFSEIFENYIKEHRELDGVFISKKTETYFLLELLGKRIICMVSIDFDSQRGMLQFDDVNYEEKRKRMFDVFFDALGNTYDKPEQIGSTQNLLHEEYIASFASSVLSRIIEYYKKKY